MDPAEARTVPVPALLFGVLLALAAAPLALGQATPAPSGGSTHIPRPDELEPGVDTTASAPAATPTPGAASPAPGAASAPRPAQPAPAAAPAKAAGGAPPKSATAAAGAKPGAARKGTDRLELEATDVTGNSELPKVLYIVPWKRSDLGDMVGRPVNSLLDEVLQPVDRDVFKRENRYYNALKAEAPAVKADAPQGSGEKP